jgi:putative ATPase
VPDHLKDAHYQGAQKLGHGIDYKYPHDFNHDWIAQQYLPTKLKNKRYFQPKGNSRFEVQLKERYQRLKKAQEQQLPPRQ